MIHSIMTVVVHVGVSSFLRTSVMERIFMGMVHGTYLSSALHLCLPKKPRSDCGRKDLYTYCGRILLEISAAWNKTILGAFLDAFVIQE